MKIYSDLKMIDESIAEAGQCYIYVLENYPQKNIKIGKTTNPVQRFRSLSGSNNGGNTINRVAISPMTYLYSLEKSCHCHFDRFRLYNTEYFDITFEEAVEFLDHLINSPSFEKCNRVRKEYYERSHKIPKLD